MSKTFIDNGSNLKLIHEDAQSSLNCIQNNIERINIKLSFVLGLSATSIYLMGNSSNQSSFLELDILGHLALVLSIGFSLVGIFPTKEVVIIKPQALIEKGLAVSEEEFRMALINNRDMVIGQLIPIQGRKAFCLKVALAAFGAAILFAILVTTAPLIPQLIETRI